LKVEVHFKDGRGFFESWHAQLPPQVFPDPGLRFFQSPRRRWAAELAMIRETMASSSGDMDL
jgi:hypothetical protein